MESEHNKPKNPNQMKKVFVMVGIAITVFLAFTVFSIKKAVTDSVQLSAIKDLYFPVLERIDGNIVRLDKMEEHFIQSVIVGESNLIDQAGEVSVEADKVFGEILKLYPQRENDIADIRKKFSTYSELATKTSRDYLKNQGKDLVAQKEQSESMNAVLREVRTKLKGFRQSSYDNFVLTLNESQAAARLNLFVGLAIGVMDLLFIGILVYFIRNNIYMMALVEEQNANLEQRVKDRTEKLNQKTNDIQAMLQNMNLGVCSIIPMNRIHSEYSQYMSTLFNKTEIANRDVSDIIFSNSTLGVDAKNQISVALSTMIGEDIIAFEFNHHLLATEMEIVTDDGKRKIIQMNWNAITNENGVIEKVLFISQDFTQLRELEIASAQQKEELNIISSILKISAGKFNEFMALAQKYIAENRQILVDAREYNKDLVAALFRNMHTIKGNARTYNFELITNASHLAEQFYDQLRQNVSRDWRSDTNRMREDLQSVDAALAKYIDINTNKLGRNGRSSDLLSNRGAFVSDAMITDLKSAITELTKNKDDEKVRHLEKMIYSLDLVQLKRLLSGVTDSLHSLCDELKKPLPMIEIEGGNIAVRTKFAEALKSSLMHIVRNSLDHGIESPEERLQNAKSVQGKLTFVSVKKNHGMELHIRDDGRGLALHKLHEKGKASGLLREGYQPTRNEIANLIFHSGLSTAAQVTQVSGRGVGLDAVKTFLTEQGADIQIALEETEDKTLGFSPFTFVISMPSSAYEVME